MSRFELTALTFGPAELGAALPITGDTVAILTGPDGAALYHAVLDSPIRDRSADLDTVPAEECGHDGHGRFRSVRDIILSPSLEGSAPHFGMADFPVAIAYLPSGGGTADAEAGALDFRAEGLISDVEDAVTRRRRAIPPLADELADDTPMTPPDGSTDGPDGEQVPDPTPPLIDPPPVAVTPADVPPPRRAGAVDPDPGPIAPPPPAPPPRPQPSAPTSGRITDTAPPSTAPTAPARRRAVGVWAAAAVAGGALLGLIGWSSTRDSGEPTEVAATVSSATSTPAPPAPTTPSLVPAAATDAELQALLPSGFPAGACTPEAAVPPGVLGALNCGPNTDPGGPIRARYTLAADRAALENQFQDVLTETRQQDCPGRIQSPGPWRKNASPDQQAGTLYCGTRDDGTAVLVWTDTARSVLAVIDAPAGAQDTTYIWWSSHS
ncbi:hypothetical protein MCEMIE22_03209 [Mycobacteriaceae bacterium]